jgi:hypothetical protein
MATGKSLCRTADTDRGKAWRAAESGYRLLGREEASTRDRTAESGLNRITDLCRPYLVVAKSVRNRRHQPQTAIATASRSNSLITLIVEHQIRAKTGMGAFQNSVAVYTSGVILSKLCIAVYHEPKKKEYKDSVFHLIIYLFFIFIFHG